MNKPKFVGIAVVVLAFVTTSLVFNNCGRSRYQGPVNNTPTVVDDESFLSGDPVVVNGNVGTLNSNGTNITSQGFVCIPSYTEQPQVRVLRKYFNGTTSVTERIGSSLYVANQTYTGADPECGGTPYAFNLNVPINQFESGVLALGDSAVSDQVFYVEAFIPGNVLAGGEDLYVPLSGAIYIPSGLSSGFHALSDQSDVLRYVYYDDIAFLIDDDPSTLAPVFYCTITETEVVTNVFSTPSGIFEDVTTITETNCPTSMNFPPTPGPGPTTPIPCSGPENVATHYFYNGKTYIGINCRYCENSSGEKDPFRSYVDLDETGFATLTAREKFPGLPCDSTSTDPGDDGSSSVAVHYIFDGRTYIGINNKYCVNDQGFTDPNVTYTALDATAFAALTALEDFPGAPCNVLVVPPPNSGDNGGNTDTSADGLGGGTGDFTAVRYSYNGRTYVAINGKYCADDAGFTDPNVVHTALTEAQYTTLTARTIFPGAPCNVLVVPPPNSGDNGGNTDTSADGLGGGVGNFTAVRYSFDGRTYVAINGKYCEDDQGFTDPNVTHTALTEAQFVTLTARVRFPGAPCNVLVEAPPESGSNSGTTDIGGGVGNFTAVRYSYDGRTYVAINGKYCADDAGFTDPNVTHTALTEAQFATLTAREIFPGSPCNQLVEPPPTSGN